MNKSSVALLSKSRFVDVIGNLGMPHKEKRKELNDVCAKDRIKEQKWHKKGVRTKFCTHQNLYISEYLGLGLGRKLYLPPLE